MSALLSLDSMLEKPSERRSRAKQCTPVSALHRLESSSASRVISRLKASNCGNGLQSRLDAKTSLGLAITIAMASLARHEHTDYETLISKHKLTRDEARQVVADEVCDLLKDWRRRKLPLIERQHPKQT